LLGLSNTGEVLHLGQRIRAKRQTISFKRQAFTRKLIIVSTGGGILLLGVRQTALNSYRLTARQNEAPIDSSSLWQSDRYKFSSYYAPELDSIMYTTCEESIDISESFYTKFRGLFGPFQTKKSSPTRRFALYEIGLRKLMPTEIRASEKPGQKAAPLGQSH
jgi:hypothetical protein